MEYFMIIVVYLLRFLQTALSIYVIIVVASALISWVQPNPYNPIVRFLYRATEPVLNKIRRAIPFIVIGGIDLSPVLLILSAQISKAMIGQVIIDLMI